MAHNTIFTLCWLTLIDSFLDQTWGFPYKKKLLNCLQTLKSYRLSQPFSFEILKKTQGQNNRRKKLGLLSTPAGGFLGPMTKTWRPSGSNLLLAPEAMAALGWNPPWPVVTPAGIPMKLLGHVLSFAQSRHSKEPLWIGAWKETNA